MDIGISPAAVRTSAEGPEFRLGTVLGYDHPTNGRQEFIYVTAGEAITGAGYMCQIASAESCQMIDTTSSAPGVGAGARVGAAMAAIAASGYGWLQIYGLATVRTLASAAVGTTLNSTATPGALDDDATGGAEVINGIFVGTATGGAEANNADCYLNYPFIGRTL